MMGVEHAAWMEGGAVATTELAMKEEAVVMEKQGGGAGVIWVVKMVAAA